MTRRASGVTAAGLLVALGAALAPAAAWAQCVGCTTTIVGADTVLTFNASGTFTPPTGVSSVTCLVVGGGGGAGGYRAAAGMSYLQGAWTGASWDQNPAARAGFGLYGSQPKSFIFQRENY